jgi:hypothetical protein
VGKTSRIDDDETRKLLADKAQPDTRDNAPDDQMFVWRADLDEHDGEVAEWLYRHGHPHGVKADVNDVRIGTSFERRIDAYYWFPKYVLAG